MVPYKTSPYMGYPYMPKIHIWLAYMHVMYGPIYDFLQGFVKFVKNSTNSGKKSTHGPLIDKFEIFNFTPVWLY